MKHFSFSHRSTQIALSLATLCTMTLFGSTAAFADTTPAASGAIGGAPKTVSGAFTGLGSNNITVLDGTQQNNKLIGTLAVTPTDATGTGLGWTVNATATALTNTDGKTLTAKISNDSTYSSDVAAPAKVDSSSSDVTSEMRPSTFDTALPTTTPLTLATANATNGMGSYTFTDAVLVDVPANTYAGTYTSTVTLDIVPLI